MHIVDKPSEATTAFNPSSRSVRTSTSNSNASKGKAGSSDLCPICARLAYRRQRRLGNVWVECDKCETWYHWSCVSPNPLDSLDAVDKWFCPTCIQASKCGPKHLEITYKPAPRKSIRASRSSLDYANLNAHLPADVDRWLRVLATREVKNDAFRKYRGEELSDQWLFREGSMSEPFLIEEPNNLGMKMPDQNLSVAEIAEIIGPSTPIEVIDCASQSSLYHWTLSQWAKYYSDPARDKVRNVISLEVSGTPLADQIQAPEIVRKLDWVENIWPTSMKEPGDYPKVQKYCLMSVARCWTDWHIDFAGSSVFYHVLRGAKVFYFIRPTPENLSAYEAWSGSTDRQENTWLGDDVDEVYKIELVAGNTMIIPTGWIHAVFTPEDALVFGGNFVHSLNIATQLRVYEIEISTKVPRKFRFPFFVKLLWLVADHYTKRLREICHTREGQPSDSGLPPPTTPKQPPHLPQDIPQDIARASDGLKVLSTFILGQADRFAKNTTSSSERRRIARENVPWDAIKNPTGLAREFRALLLKIRGENEGPLQLWSEESKSIDSDNKAEMTLPVSQQSSKAVVQENPSKSTKRKADADANGRKWKPRLNSLSSAESNGQSKRQAHKLMGDANIISRNVLTSKPVIRREFRIDPLLHLDQKPRDAEITFSENTNEVVRRIVAEDGSTTLETRTVITKIERVKWDAKSEKSPSDNNFAVKESVPTKLADGKETESPLEVANSFHHDLRMTRAISPSTPPVVDDELSPEDSMISHTHSKINGKPDEVTTTVAIPMQVDFDLLAEIGATIAKTESFLRG